MNPGDLFVIKRNISAQSHLIVSGRRQWPIEIKPGVVCIVISENVVSPNRKRLVFLTPNGKFTTFFTHLNKFEVIAVNV